MKRRKEESMERANVMDIPEVNDFNSGSGSGSLPFQGGDVAERREARSATGVVTAGQYDLGYHKSYCRHTFQAHDAN